MERPLARIVIRGLATVVALALAGALTWVGFGVWPRPFPFPRRSPSPEVVLYGERVAFRIPADALAVEVATFRNRLTAYLDYQYLCTAPPVRGAEVLIGSHQSPRGSFYRLYILVDNDVVRAVPYLENLVVARLIRGFALLPATAARVSGWQRETEEMDAAFRTPFHGNLESLSSAQLLPPLAHFVRFKAETDPRVVAGWQPVLLSRRQANLLAGDILDVAQFYGVPLDFFLGIGAMENDYMNVTGDLAHTVWKRRPQPGDIVLQRRRGRVRVLNDSLGVWQITRETLRYAHALYLGDHRDYMKLPAALRPPRQLDLNKVKPRTLTTYAGLLFRDLLDRFHGDVRMAVGAYNGGIRRPDLVYAADVESIASYARRVLEHAALLERPPGTPQFSAASWRGFSGSRVESPPGDVADSARRIPE